MGHATTASAGASKCSKVKRFGRMLIQLIQQRVQLQKRVDSGENRTKSGRRVPSVKVTRGDDVEDKMMTQETSSDLPKQGTRSSEGQVVGRK